MAQLHVTIVTPERKVLDAAAAEVSLPAWNGELGVYPDHDQLLTLLRAGKCTVVGSDGPASFVVGRGFAEITGDAVTILTASCVAVSQIDAGKSRAQLAGAEEALAAAEYGTEAFRQAEIALEHARALTEV
jgi:F-type H+-transporting ATPase subunit epsilon